MKCSYAGLVAAAATLGFPLLDSGASAQPGGVSTTPDNQILVALDSRGASYETTPAGTR